MTMLGGVFMPFFYDSTYFVFVLPFVLLAAYAQYKVSSNYKYYAKVRNERNMTGAEVARIILDRNNLHHVKINQVAGTLSDHYDPRNQTVNLSEGVYSQPSISAASIAAHEVGHAIQHEVNYMPLKIRSAIVPVVAFSSQFVWIIIMVGFLFDFTNLIKLGIFIFVGTVIFQLVTLPVEFDASRRAIRELSNGLISPDEKSGSKKVLQAAALTYVAATLASIGQLLRLITLSSRNNDN